MPISPYIAALRESVGHDLLLLPSVAALPHDADGRVLLVKQSDTGLWATIGGLVEVDESPEQAAVREASEEAGVTLRLTHILGATGGPDFQITYPNGDRVAYVSIVYDAVVVAGDAQPDGDETTDVRWFDHHDLATLPLHPFARSTFAALGR